MLDIQGEKNQGFSHCDGFSRRNFIKVGGMALGGLSLGQLLELDAKEGKGRKATWHLSAHGQGQLSVVRESALS